MHTIKNDHVVEIRYTLTDRTGERIASNKEKSSISFIQGKHQIPPGLETELQGRQVGERFKATLPPKQAYGIRDESLVQTLPLNDFGPEAKTIVVGDLVQIQNDDGQIITVEAVAVNDHEITLDANHKLAGKTLTFGIEVLSIREATIEELVNGYPFIESCCVSGSCRQ